MAGFRIRLNDTEQYDVDVPDEKVEEFRANMAKSGVQATETVNVRFKPRTGSKKQYEAVIAKDHVPTILDRSRTSDFDVELPDGMRKPKIKPEKGSFWREVGKTFTDIGVNVDQATQGIYEAGKDLSGKMREKRSVPSQDARSPNAGSDYYRQALEAIQPPKPPNPDVNPGTGTIKPDTAIAVNRRLERLQAEKDEAQQAKDRLDQFRKERDTITPNVEQAKEILLQLSNVATAPPPAGEEKQRAVDPDFYTKKLNVPSEELLNMDKAMKDAGIKPEDLLAPKVIDAGNQIIGNLAQGYLKGMAGMPKSVAIGGKWMDEQLPEWAQSYSHMTTQQLATWKMGEALEKMADTFWPTDPERQDDFIQGVLPQAMGSMLTFLTGSGATGAMTTKVPFMAAKKGFEKAAQTAVMTTASGVMGAGMEGASMYEEALGAGKSEDIARRAFKWGALVGTSEMLPIGHAFNRIAKVGGVRGMKRLFLDGGIQAVEEAIQEGGQTLAENRIAQVMIDDMRELTDGLTPAAGAGAISGYMTEMLLAILPGRHAMSRSARKKHGYKTDMDMAAAVGIYRETPTTFEEAEALHKDIGDALVVERAKTNSFVIEEDFGERRGPEAMKNPKAKIVDREKDAMNPTSDEAYIRKLDTTWTSYKQALNAGWNPKGAVGRSAKESHELVMELQSITGKLDQYAELEEVQTMIDHIEEDMVPNIRLIDRKYVKTFVAQANEKIRDQEDRDTLKEALKTRVEAEKSTGTENVPPVTPPTAVDQPEEPIPQPTPPTPEEPSIIPKPQESTPPAPTRSGVAAGSPATSSEEEGVEGEGGRVAIPAPDESTLDTMSKVLVDNAISSGLKNRGAMLQMAAAIAKYDNTGQIQVNNVIEAQAYFDRGDGTWDETLEQAISRIKATGTPEEQERIAQIESTLFETVVRKNRPEPPPEDEEIDTPKDEVSDLDYINWGGKIQNGQGGQDTIRPENIDKIIQNNKGWVTRTEQALEAMEGRDPAEKFADYTDQTVEDKRTLETRVLANAREVVAALEKLKESAEDDAVPVTNDDLRKATNDRELDALLMKKGAYHLPGLRLGDAQDAGTAAGMVERGEMTIEEWDEWVERLKAENRFTDLNAPIRAPVPLSDPLSVEKAAGTVPHTPPPTTPEEDAVVEPTKDGVTVTSPEGEAKAEEGTLTPQQQKDFLLQEIDAALLKAPEDDVIRADGDTGQVTFEVPGDGVFVVNNTPKALKTFRENVDKRFPVKKARPDILKAPIRRSYGAEELSVKMSQNPDLITQYETQLENGVYGETDARNIRKAIDRAQSVFGVKRPPKKKKPIPPTPPAATPDDDDIGTPTDIKIVALSRRMDAILDDPNTPVKDNPSLRLWVAEQYNVEPGSLSSEFGYGHKTVQEAYEAALVRKARRVVLEGRKAGDSNEEILGRLTALKARQVTLNARTGTSSREQQYSTPIDYAFVAGLHAGIETAAIVGDPTAGNGALTIGADPETQGIFGNEIHQDRSDLFEAESGKIVVENKNAETESAGGLGIMAWKADTQVINPPFGKAKEPQTIDGYRLSQREHIIAAKSLNGAPDDVQASIIIAGVHPTRHGTGDRAARPMYDFMGWLHSMYNITGVYDVSGSVYGKQGTTYPTYMITVNGRRNKQLTSEQVGNAYSTLPDTFDSTVESLYQAYVEAKENGLLDRRKRNEDGTGLPPADGTGGESGPESVPGPDTTQNGRGNRPGRGGGAGSGTISGGRGNQPDTGGDSSTGTGTGGIDSLGEDGSLGEGTDTGRTDLPPGGEEGGAPNEPGPPGDTETGGGTDGESATGGASEAVDSSSTDADLAARRKVLEDRLKNKMGRMHSGIDPEFFRDSIEYSYILIRQGSRTFTKFAREMIAMLGERVRPYLKSMYANVMLDSRFTDVREGATLIERVNKSTKQDLDEILEGKDPLTEEIKVEEKKPPEKKAEVIEDLQVKYDSASLGYDLGALIPRNMARSTKEALQRVEAKYGPVDLFVARELGYKSQEAFHIAFAGSQVDGLALAIYNHKNNGQGIVIGDQTGMGKGRVAAGMLRYSHRIGYKPVFCSQSEGLFTDMYRDLIDIGGFVGKDGKEFIPKPFVMNEASKIYDPRNDDEQKLLFGPIPVAKKRRLVNSWSRGGFNSGGMKDYDLVCTTYSQVQNLTTSASNVAGMLAIAKQTMFVLDEAHEASGKDSNRGEIFRTVVAESPGVTFLTATFAKNPSNLALYTNTILGDCGMGFDDMVSALENAGTPLQEWVSEMLGREGQMIRREQSFEGVEFGLIKPDVDLKKMEKTFDDSTSVLRAVIRFSQLTAGVIDQLGNSLNGGRASSSERPFNVKGTNFASVVHNYISQLLMASKAEAAVKATIDKLKIDPATGKPTQKVVLTAEFTAESTLKYLGIGPGSNLEMDNFGVVLHRGLHSATKYKVTARGTNISEDRWLDPRGPKPDGVEDDIWRIWVQDYNAIEKQIDDSNITAPVSPYDYIRNELEKRGIKAGEVTGRSFRVDEDGLVSERSKADKNKVNTVRTFNNGELDVVLINASGSTGISMHASEKYKDQKKRVMITIQPHGNISTQIQMFGRINRVKQVTLPEIYVMRTDLPAELRPIAALIKKMKSLSANTSADSNTLMAIPGADIFNKYGDRVVREYLASDEGREFVYTLGLKTDDDGGLATSEYHELAKHATGRLAILENEDQHRFYDYIFPVYDQLIDELTAEGRNDLISQHLDLQAERIEGEEDVIIASDSGTGSKNPLSAGAILRNYRVRKIGSAQSAAEVQALLNTHKASKEVAMDLITGKGMTFAESHENEKVRNLIKSHVTRTRDMVKGLVLGESYAFKRSGGGDNTEHGVLIEIRSNEAAKNPGTMGGITLVFAINDARRIIREPFSRIDSMTREGTDLLKNWDAGKEETYETRAIVMGNLLIGSSILGQSDTKVNMISFTTKDGGFERGLLLPLEQSTRAALGKVSVDPETLMGLIEAGIVTSFTCGPVTAKDISVGSNLQWSVVVPKSNNEKIWQNESLNELAINEFTESTRGRKNYTAFFAPRDIGAVVGWLSDNIGMLVVSRNSSVDEFVQRPGDDGETTRSGGPSAADGSGDRTEGEEPESKSRPPKKPGKSYGRHYKTDVAGKKPRITIATLPRAGRGKPKKIRTIIVDIRKKFGVNVRYGPMRSGANKFAGEFNGRTGSVRVRLYGNLGTTTHELGHAIDAAHGVIEGLNQKQNIRFDSELMDFWVYGSVKKRGRASKIGYKRQEGFAEYLHAWLLNPAAAEKQAPRFTKYFKDKIPAKVLHDLRGYGDDIRAWVGSDPKEQIISNVQMAPDSRSIFEMLAPRDEHGNYTITALDRLSQAWLNDLHLFEAAVKFAREAGGVGDILPERDPVTLARLHRGIHDKMDYILDYGMMNGQNNVVTGGGLDWLMEPLTGMPAKEQEELLEHAIAYMIAQRVIDRSEKKREDTIANLGGGFLRSVDVAKRQINVIEKGNKKRRELVQDLAARYRQWADANLRYMVQKGRLSMAKYKEISEWNAYYIAFQRILEANPEEPFEFTGDMVSKYLGDVDEGVVRGLKGSPKQFKNPYAELIHSTYRIVNESDRNEIMTRFIELLEGVPVQGGNRQFVQVPSKDGKPMLADIGDKAGAKNGNTIPVFVNGKKVFYQFTPELFAALKGLDIHTDQHRIYILASKLASILRGGIVYSVPFANRNLIRDIQHRFQVSRARSQDSVIATLKRSSTETLDDLKKSGGGLSSGYYLKNETNYYRTLQAAINSMASDKKSIIMHPGMVLDGYKRMIEKSELFNRKREYEASHKYAEEVLGYNEYNAGLYAALQARDLIDFAIAGSWARWINGVVPFFNAAIQGLRRTVVAFREDPGAFISMWTVTSVLPTMAMRILAEMMDYDDEYEDLPNYQRDLFWNFKVAPDFWIHIPKNFEMGCLSSVADRAYSWAKGDERAFDGYPMNLVRSIVPVDVTTWLGPLQAYIQATFKHDLFRDRDIIPYWEQHANLSEREYMQYASSMGNAYSTLAQNSNIKHSDWADARIFDYLIKAQFGILGDQAISLGNTVANLTRDEDEGKKRGLNIHKALGLTGPSPAHASPDVQWVMTWQKQEKIGPTSSKLARFKSMKTRYFEAYPEEKDEAAKNWREEATRLRDMYEEKD